MKKSIGNFSLEGWTPTPLEQALMDGTIDEYLATAANPDDEEIPSDFLEVQEFGEAMEEVKAELEDDINASEIFAERFEHLADEEVKAMYRVYMLTPYSACFYKPFLLLRKVDGSFVSLPEQLPLEELQEALRWRYHFSEEQVIVSEVMGKPRIHVLAADNSDDEQWQDADNLAVIKEEVAQWGYSGRRRRVFHLFIRSRMGNVNSHHIDNLLLNTLIPLDVVDVIKEDDEMGEVAMSIPQWLQKKVVSITRGEPICCRKGTAFHTYYITFYICHSFLMEIGITDMWAIDHSILPKIYKKFLKILAECETPIQIDSRSMLEEAPKSSCSYSTIVDDDEKEQYKVRLMDMARSTGHIFEMETTASHVIIGVPTAECTIHILWAYNIPSEQF